MSSSFKQSLVQQYFRLQRLSPFISKRYFHLNGEEFFDVAKFKKQRIAPNLIIVGAQKSGTTSLHNYLDHHPDIFMSKPIKEPGYFCDFEFIADYFKSLPEKKVFKSRTDILKNYMLQGYNGEQYFGESSTYYSDGFQNEKFEVVKRIFESNRDTKLIYILRNPLARVVSGYLHHQRKGYTDLPLNEFLEKEKSVLEISLYGKQLDSFLKFFPREQIHIAFFEDLIEAPNKVINGVAEFLNLPSFESNLSLGKFNVSTNKKQFKGNELKISGENYAHLIEQILPDVRLFEELSGMKASHWSFEKENWCLN